MPEQKFTPEEHFTIQYDLLTDTVTITDSSVARSVQRPLSDSLSLSDSCEVLIVGGGEGEIHFDYTLSLSDTIAVADYFTYEKMGGEGEIHFDYTYSANETITLSDSFSSSGTITAELSESLSLADSITRAISRDFADSVTISDALNFGRYKAISDSLTISDSVDARLVQTIDLNDSFTLSHDEIFSVGHVISESVVVSDALSKSVSVAKSDSLSLTDSRVLSVSKVATDTISISDSYVKSISHAISQDVSMSDAFVKGISRGITESLTVSSSIDTSGGLNINMSDNLFLSDVCTKEVYVDFSESVVMADTTTFLKGGVIIFGISQGLTVSDFVNAERITKSLYEKPKIVSIEGTPILSRVKDTSKLRVAIGVKEKDD